MKITAADTEFGRCVKARVSYRCERCGTQYQAGDSGLHTSHYYGRRSYSVRFHPYNAFAMCAGCHFHLTANPEDHRNWYHFNVPEDRIKEVLELREDTNIGKLFKKNQKAIAKHYRNQFKDIQRERADGERGRIEFEGIEPGNL